MASYGYTVLTCAGEHAVGMLEYVRYSCESTSTQPKPEGYRR